jgi:hypothetical protein
MLMMKWKNPGITYFGGGGSGGGGSSKTQRGFGGSYSAQSDETNTQESSNTQENETEITTPDRSSITDPQQSFKEASDQVVSLQDQLNSLTSRDDQDNQEVQNEIKSVTEQLNQAQQTKDYTNSLLQNQMQQGQKEMVVGASTDPGSLVEKSDTEQIVATPESLINEAAGQVQQPTPQAQTSEVQQAATTETPEATQEATMEATTVAEQVSQAAEGVEPAVAQPSPKATVQGQLEELMADFEGGGTPPWASGSMRKAMGVMQQRGLGASSMAGQAVVQSAMESALSIAQQDAQTAAQFEMQNLNNRQQASIFKTQQTIAGLFSDQAAENAAKQFNATSKNQTDRFFANLEANASQFNAAQVNAISQFNAGERNVIEEFNTQLKSQRQMFETQNSLAIAQANAQWRQNIATANTSAANAANMEYAKTTNGLTAAQLDQIWQRERDLMDFAFTSSESSLDRSHAILLQKLSNKSSKEAIKMQADMEKDAAMGSFVAQAVGGLMGII